MFKSFINEIERVKRDSIYATTLLVLPIFALIFFVCFFSKSGIKNLPIALLDNDKSSLSRRVADMIDSTAAVEIVFSVESSHEGLEFILDGKAYAVVVIPDNFENNCLNGNTTHIELYNTGTNISTNGFIERDIQTVATTFGAGVAIEYLQAVGELYNKALATVMPIRIAEHTLFNPYMNYAYYLAPCFMAMMVVIFTLITTIYALYGSKITSVAKLVATCLPVTVTMSVLSAIMLFILFGVIGVPLKGSITIIALANAMLILSYQAVAILFVGISGSLHTALSLGGGYSVIAFTFSGFTFPVMAMAVVLQIFSHLFPFTYYMNIFIDQAMRGAEWYISLSDLGYMMLFLTLPLFVYRRL